MFSLRNLLNLWIEMAEKGLMLAIGLVAVGDFDDQDSLFLVGDGIDDAVAALAEVVLLPAGQFFAAGRLRIAG